MKQIIKPPIQYTGSESKLIELMKWAEQVSRMLNKLVDAIPADSTAANTAEIVSDFNGLLEALRNLDAR